MAPISLREAQFLVKLDAQKLLTKSTLYDLSGYRLRIFKEQAQNNQRIQMFGVPGMQFSIFDMANQNINEVIS